VSCFDLHPERRASLPERSDENASEMGR
jgi:hypothetical protein